MQIRLITAKKPKVFDLKNFFGDEISNRIITFLILSHLDISPIFFLISLKFGTYEDVAKEITRMANDIHTDEIIQEGIFRFYIRLLRRLLSRQWRIRPRRRPRPFSSFIRQSHGGAFRVTRSWPSLKEEAGRRRPLQQPSFVSATLALALKRPTSNNVFSRTVFWKRYKKTKISTVKAAYYGLFAMTVFCTIWWPLHGSTSMNTTCYYHGTEWKQAHGYFCGVCGTCHNNT